MSWVLIEPGDVWSFRDGRPLLTGGGSLSRSIFPPAPFTMQGALRSLILGHSDVEWSAFREQSTPKAKALGQVIGHPASEGQSASLGAFSLYGPFLARKENGKWVRYSPLPADVRRTKTRIPQYFALQPSSNQVFETNWPVSDLKPLWPRLEENVEAVEEPRWLSEQALDDYLHNRPFGALLARELFSTEPRLGIALDYSQRRPLKGMLYQIEFIRPHEEVGLLVWLSDFVNLPDSQGAMRIGGEGRVAYYRTLKNDEIKVDAGTKQKVQRFKVVFLTPTWFDGGWQPTGGDAGWSKLLGHPVNLISASLGRSEHVGGWDIAAQGGRGWHKPIRTFVPAGSIYFFKTTEPMAPPSGPLCHTPVEEELPLDRLGFGQIAVGIWDWLS